MENTGKIRAHFEEEAYEFDQIILKLIPHYENMIQALVNALPFDRELNVSVIDLGCGTGTVSLSIKKAFPNARITCLDIASNMIEMAKIKLKDDTNCSFIVGDFASYVFDKKYDVIVSSLALHHLETDGKRSFYAKIYEALEPKGVFCNADVVLGSNDDLQQRYMEQWKEFMSRNVSLEEINNKWIPKYYEEDRPSKLMNQLVWLREIGFSEVDVPWKYYNFAVYGGRKL